MLLLLTEFCFLTYAVPAATGVKGYDEDSVASLSMTQDETQDTGVANGGHSHPFQGGGYMLAASYWPKVNCTFATKHLNILAIFWFC